MTESRPIAESSQPLPASPTSTDATGAGARSSFRTALPILLVVGALAGAAGSEVIHRTQNVFWVAPDRMGNPPYPPDVERDRLLCAIGNHAIGFGGLGLLLGGGLGLGLGVLRGTPGAAFRSLLVGGGLGLLLGALGGIAAYLTNEALVTIPLDGIFKAILIHLPNWLLLAVAIAIAAALVRQPGTRVGQLLSSALVAGVVAALLYPLVALIFFRAANPDRPIPFETGLRLVCFVVGGVVLGVAAARWLRSPPPVPSST
jgi:hypothetical protein